MIQIYADGALVYDSRLEGNDLKGLKVTRGLNKGGTAEIIMPADHPAYSSFTGYKTIVEIYRDGRLKFRGRALYPVDDFYNQRTVVCEGEMCFLQDAIIRPYLYQDSPEQIFRDVIENYNLQVDTFKRFKIGGVTVTDPNDYVRLECESAETALAVVNKMVERCGGYIRFTTDNTGARVIHWLESVGTNTAQTIELGENLFSFSRSGANTSLATVLVPYGAKDEETGERLTIEGVNGGIDYIMDADAVERHGRIVATATWDDVTDAANLLKKARQHLTERKLVVTSLSLTALDLSYVDKTVGSFEDGDWVRVLSGVHGLDEAFQITDMAENLLNPVDGLLNLGKEIRSLTSQDVAGDQKSKSEMQQTAAGIKRDFDINVKQAVDKALEGTTEELTSLIEQKVDSITLEVSGSLGSKAQIQIKGESGGGRIAELDLTEVRQAFANDASSVTISGGVVTFNSGTLIINSTNLQVSADGTIKATNAELTGTATTVSGLYKSELSGGRLRFLYDGTEYGGIASDHIDETAKRGVTVRLLDNASYMGFSRLNPDLEMYEMWYCINFGADIGGLTDRHLFFGSALFSNEVTVAGAVRFGSTSDFSGEANFYGETYFDAVTTFNNTAIFFDAAVFAHNATFNEAVFFEALATYNEAVKFNENAFFANGKGVALYKTDGKTVFSMTVQSDDKLYFGSTSIPVSVVGSSVQIGHASYPTTIAGSSVTVNNSLSVVGAAIFPNGFGVMIKDSGGTARYVMSVGASNQLILGDSSLPVYLRCTGVTIGTGGLALGKGSVILANGYGVVIADSGGASQYVLSLTSGNQVNVGVASYVTYLRGTAVYLASSGAAVTSDERKKNSIEALPDAYEALLDKLTPVRYKYNDGTSGRYHAGFIAQEVREALESVGLTTQDFGGFVDLNGDGEELGLIYAEFIALLLNKIKRQELRIAALENR